MREDETGGGRDRSVDGPDPAFIRRLEDDSLWSPRGGAQDVRRATRQGVRASRATTARQRRHDRRKARRSRWITVAVFVVVALVITIVGLELKASEYGSSGGKTTPFTVLPLDSVRITTTTAPPVSSTTTTTPPTTTTSAPPATSTSMPVAVVDLR